MIRVELRTYSQPGRAPSAQVFLRELAGFDELAAGSATDLVDRLLVDRHGSAAGPGEAETLSLSNIDQILAEIYRHLYGDGVEAQVSCSACGLAWSLSFTVTDLIESISSRSDEDLALLARVDGPGEQGVYSLDGSRFRLPTGADLAAVADLGSGEVERALRARCVLDQDPGHADQMLDRAMSLIGPTLDMELEAACPECGAEQDVPFRMDEFLIAALRRESALLTREVHELARAYRWSRREILEIPRAERRQYAGLVLAQATASGGWS
jgi:hypothetical protein